MIRFILLALLLLLVARLFWRVMDAVIEGAGGGRRGKRGDTAAGVTLVKDPICGTFVAPRTALPLRAGSTVHYFCSEQCRTEYRRTR